MKIKKIYFLILFVLVLSCSNVPRKVIKPENAGRVGIFDYLMSLEEAGPSRKWHSNIERSISKKRLAILKRVPMRWPLNSVFITSPFGPRRSSFHDGVDLRARIGTPVYAAHSGRVLYSGNKISGYGKIVILKHPSGLMTIYAHNSRYIVKKGQKIKEGQKIAYAGNSGRSSGPHLHFEIRDGVLSVDPLDILDPNVRGTLLSQKNEEQKKSTRR